jgi:hypothetical protein
LFSGHGVGCKIGIASAVSTGADFFILASNWLRKFLKVWYAKEYLAA